MPDSRVGRLLVNSLRPQMNESAWSCHGTDYGQLRNCVSLPKLVYMPELSEPLGLGHPFRGTHKKMTEMNEQELHELMRLKHHSHGLKNQHLG